jgi:phosphoserine phosphatase
LQRPGQDAAAVFDADGTLWTGDVGEDVFEYALREDLLRQDVEEPLGQLAACHGIERRGRAADLARALYEAYRQGRFPEPLICEVMAWVFAGSPVADIDAVIARALAERRLEDRLLLEMKPILAWARAEGVRAVVVSASPERVVFQAALLWGFEPDDIVAARARIRAGRYTVGLEAPLPYEEQKVIAARALLGDVNWLAAFGNSLFDLHMLRAARLAVAVQPKADLYAGLSDVPHAVVLDSSSTGST